MKNENTLLTRFCCEWWVQGISLGARTEIEFFWFLAWEENIAIDFHKMWNMRKICNMIEITGKRKRRKFPWNRFDLQQMVADWRRHEWNIFACLCFHEIWSMPYKQLNLHFYALIWFGSRIYLIQASMDCSSVVTSLLMWIICASGTIYTDDMTSGFNTFYCDVLKWLSRKKLEIDFSFIKQFSRCTSTSRSRLILIT